MSKTKHIWCHRPADFPRDDGPRAFCKKPEEHKISLALLPDNDAEFGWYCHACLMEGIQK